MAEIVLGLGGAILSPIVQVLFDRMASLKAFEFGQWKPSDEVLKKLKTPLLLINAVLNDAEEKQITNPAVKEWVIELKDVAYDHYKKRACLAAFFWAAFLKTRPKTT